MKSKSSRNFDCVKFMREARRKNYEATRHLSGKEFDEFWRKFRESDPVWQRWVAKQAAIGRKTPP